MLSTKTKPRQAAWQAIAKLEKRKTGGFFWLPAEAELLMRSSAFVLQWVRLELRVNTILLPATHASSYFNETKDFAAMGYPPALRFAIFLHTTHLSGGITESTLHGA